MKTRLLATAISVILILGVLTGFASADAVFHDVPSDAWYANAVHYCYENDLITGTSQTTFAPDTELNRAMLVTILHRAAGTPSVTGTTDFKDVSSGTWYTDAVVWAFQNSMINGYGNGLFGTNDPITREQLLTILWNYDGKKAATKSASYADMSLVSTWAKDAAAWGDEHEIANLKEGNRLDPKGNATRAEAAYMLYQYLNNKENTADLSESGSMPETTTYRINGVDFKMVLVEGGTFTMGSNSRESNQSPEHEVTLSSYLMGETEVTQALWNAVMGFGGGSNEYPIASVTKPECDIFASRLSELAHETGMIPANMNFHVPTEAQWEFASKGGNLSKGYTYSGSNTLSEVGWTSNDGSSVHKVKQKNPNELGLYDMSGNVYEWVADYAGSYSPDAQTDPCNLTTSNNYVKRGGSFYYNDSYRFTSTYRYFYSSTDYTIGVRICLY